ncbi:hypothetical protein D5S17_21675 [Pseudonocardiaceae bacterium YIM PH 21723]|nr:hypothetical protein D5S17_21675 [Pseudonocardiaceae bacterium YIM PH 21723]
MAILATGAGLMGFAGNAMAIGDTGTGGSGNATLVGPVVAPVEANGIATNAAQHVNANVCDTSAAVLGANVPVGPKSTDCTAASTSGGVHNGNNDGQGFRGGSGGDHHAN